MLTTPLNIRLAELTDINPLKEISITTFIETFANQNTKENMYKYINEVFNPNQLLAELNDDQNQFFLAVLKDEIIGYAKMRKGTSPEQIKNRNTIEIERIYVLKAYHNMKVGASLVSHCI